MKKSTIGKVLLVTGGIAVTSVIVKALCAVDWKDVKGCCARQIKRLLKIDEDIPEDFDDDGFDDDEEDFFDDDDLDDKHKYIVLPSDAKEEEPQPEPNEVKDEEATTEIPPED